MSFTSKLHEVTESKLREDLEAAANKMATNAGKKPGTPEHKALAAKFLAAAKKKQKSDNKEGFVNEAKPSVPKKDKEKKVADGMLKKGYKFAIVFSSGKDPLYTKSQQQAIDLMNDDYKDEKYYKILPIEKFKSEFLGEGKIPPQFKKFIKKKGDKKDSEDEEDDEEDEDEEGDDKDKKKKKDKEKKESEADEYEAKIDAAAETMTLKAGRTKGTPEFDATKEKFLKSIFRSKTNEMVSESEDDEEPETTKATLQELISAVLEGRDANEVVETMYCIPVMKVHDDGSMEYAGADDYDDDDDDYDDAPRAMDYDPTMDRQMAYGNDMPMNSYDEPMGMDSYDSFESTNVNNLQRMISMVRAGGSPMEAVRDITKPKK